MSAVRALFLALFLTATLLTTSAAVAKDEQFFVSIYYEGDKIGQAHLRISRADDGEMEALRTRASVSLLDVELYEFTQDLKQVWDDGQLESLSGRTDENGTIHQLDLKRDHNGYTGTIDGKSVTLPATAFPDAIWHYAIAEHKLLFSQVNLKLLNVEIDHSSEDISFHGDTVSTTRVGIKGDFNATIWFDEDKHFLKANSELSEHTIEVVRDP